MVRDPYWLHCYWELCPRSLQRAEAALGQDWHTATPVLRLFDISGRDTGGTGEAFVRDIPIHGGCNNWYVELSNPPRSYRVDIGYRSRRGRFYALTRSNIVTTPEPGVCDRVDENWSDLDVHKAEHIYAMSGGGDPNSSDVQLKHLFEERLRRPLGGPAATCFGWGAYPAGRPRKLSFHLDADLVVYGSARPKARVSVQGDPIKLRPDGTFVLRYRLPDSRLLIPATACSSDGIEEQTIILSVERNTKKLEPTTRDLNSEE
jgi:hypothetical protein